MNRSRAWHIVTVCGFVCLAASCGDEDDPDNPTSSGSSSTASATGSGASGTGASGGFGATGGGGSGATGGGGEGGGACTTTAPGPTRGSAIAMSPDDSTLMIANRDSGSVTMMNVTWPDAQPSLLFVSEVKEFTGAEPWQVAINGCGDRAYVALRADQKVVELVDVALDPKVGLSATVGSEPTALALSPNNTKLYVANWVDGTVSVIDPATMQVTTTIDLNPALVATTTLGTVTSRKGLAHPRSIAITNDGDTDDTDEKIYVTEYFAQRFAPESDTGKNSDTNKRGYVYRISAADDSVTAIPLEPIADTGFADSSGTATGCFPNQLQSVTVNGKFAYVTSICASPVGPLGIFQKGMCAGNAQCTAPAICSTATGGCTGSCTQDSECGFGSPAGTCAPDGSCKPIPTNVKTTTHPAVHVIDTSTDAEVASARTNLNQAFQTLYDTNAVADTDARRMPLVANDIGFVPGTGEGYITANGTDAIFRVVYDPVNSNLTDKGGGAGKEHISLFIEEAAKRGQNPVGIAVAHGQPFAFVSNDVSRNVSAIDFAKQIVALSDTADAAVEQASPPPFDPADQARLRGKRFFNTGLGRWSFKGQGWGACQSCHIDGLTDNVTWYFARGPRQSVSLDGSFASMDPTDQRIFNWTAFLDEVDDFELNTRGVSGGVGALVTVDNNPPTNADRINLNDTTLFPPAGATALNGSAAAATGASVLEDWTDVTEWIKALRSPRGVSGLDAAKVDAGKTVFTDLTTGGVCQGCHSGAKWTISTRFYTPAGTIMEALLTTSWDSAVTGSGFPADLLPAADAAQRLMRAPSPKNGNLDQILCAIRPVGTFGVSPPEVNVKELRANMVAAGQGNETNGKGYNPPGLLGMAVAAPYLHAGNARTLEELFSATFAEHTTALNASFQPTATDIENLIAFLLSIDESTTVIPIPALGSTGGSFCAAP